jgi:hypothetical protein
MPRYIILPIGRFHENLHKTDYPIEGFNQDSQQFGIMQYRTVAALVHYGMGLRDGHYTALIRLENGTWAEASDERITYNVPFPRNLQTVTLLCCEKITN